MNTHPSTITRAWSRRAAATALSALLLGGAALYHPPGHSQAGTECFDGGSGGWRELQKGARGFWHTYRFTPNGMI